MGAERDLVASHVDSLLDEATRQGIPHDVISRLLLQRLIDLWLESRSREDVASELRFAIDHLDPDQDFTFMRP